MKKILCISLISASITANSFAYTDINISQSISALKRHKVFKGLTKIIKRTSVNYGITYLGPSLSNDYQEGATYNRFNSGQDFKGDNVDPTSSLQVYHAFSFGYQVSRNLKLSYSSTYQDDLNSGVNYNSYWADGSVSGVYQRNNGVSHNNNRINAFITNIYSNNYFYLMANLYYELPTTQISESNHMNYGLGFQPVIGIFSNINGISHGIRMSVERDFYQTNETLYPGNIYPSRQQTARVSFTPYVNYQFNDKLSLKTQVTFDWDKKGDQIHNLHEFNANMDDVFEIGPDYYISKNIRFGLRVQKAITDPSPEKSAVLGRLNLSI